MSAVTVSRIGDRLVVVKAAAGDPAERIRSEARVLQALEHPGLVQLVDFDDSEDSVALRTAFAGPDTWASRPLLHPIERAAGIAAVAATLADLHSRGVTHGSLRADHVIRGDDDRPILCGLSRTRGDGPAERRADIEALAALIEQPPLPDGAATVALGALARRMQAGGCDVSHVVQEANRIAADAGNEAAAADRRRHLVGAAVVVAVAAGGTIAVAGATQLGEPESRPPITSPAPRSEPASTTSSVTSTVPRNPSIEPVAPPNAGGVGLDHGGRRYVIGNEGDIVVLGDWDCDGDPTPALLRPGTGEIAVFDRWPEPHGTVSSPSAWVITDARALSPEPDGDCDRLRVTTPAGSRLLETEPPS